MAHKETPTQQHRLQHRLQSLRRRLQGSSVCSLPLCCFCNCSHYSSFPTSAPPHLFLIAGRQIKISELVQTTWNCCSAVRKLYFYLYCITIFICTSSERATGPLESSIILFEKNTENEIKFGQLRAYLSVKARVLRVQISTFYFQFLANFFFIPRRKHLCATIFIMSASEKRERRKKNSKRK